MASLKVLTEEVVEWADQIAPNRLPQDAAIKAVSEMSELLDAVVNKDFLAVEDELGDMIILLADIANMYTINLIDAGFMKMRRNREAKWETVDGVLRRIK